MKLSPLTSNNFLMFFLMEGHLNLKGKRPPFLLFKNPPHIGILVVTKKLNHLLIVEVSEHYKNDFVLASSLQKTH